LGTILLGQKPILTLLGTDGQGANTYHGHFNATQYPLINHDVEFATQIKNNHRLRDHEKGEAAIKLYRKWVYLFLNPHNAHLPEDVIAELSKSITEGNIEDWLSVDTKHWIEMAVTLIFVTYHAKYAKKKAFWEYSSAYQKPQKVVEEVKAENANENDKNRSSMPSVAPIAPSQSILPNLYVGNPAKPIQMSVLDHTEVTSGASVSIRDIIGQKITYNIFDGRLFMDDLFAKASGSATGASSSAASSSSRSSQSTSSSALSSEPSSQSEVINVAKQTKSPIHSRGSEMSQEEKDDEVNLKQLEGKYLKKNLTH
jgi:hypothetical protein